MDPMRWENEPVRAAVIFGSAVDDIARARDIDVAVFPKPGAEIDATALWSRLEKEFDRPVDLVVMAPGHSLTLGYEIAAKHRVLYEETHGGFDEICSVLVRMYWDGEKFRTRRKRLIEEALRNVS